MQVIRAATARSKLISNQLDTIGIALRQKAVTVEDALQWAVDEGIADLLQFGPPSKQGGQAMSKRAPTEDEFRARIASFNRDEAQQKANGSAAIIDFATRTPVTGEAMVAPGVSIKSSKQFVASFVPPDYIIDGLLQEGFLYSLTGATGAGKTAITLRLAASVALGV